MHSIGFNTSVNFLIFTDQPITAILPANVKFINFSLDDFKKLARKKIGCQIIVNSPYKICDYKPAFGLIFDDYLKEFDFWAHCDIDIIFGNIRRFITAAKLRSFDYISVRHDYTTGCFSIYRNTALVNNLFRNSKDYKKVFSTEQHLCFDECNFKHQSLLNGCSIFEAETEIESYTEVIKAATAKRLIRSHFDFLIIEGIPGKLKFDRGRLIYKSKYEALLYHLVIFKQLNYKERLAKILRDQYLISKTRIYPS